MKFQAFDKDGGEVKVYAVEISRKEILAVSFTEEDQKLFTSCSQGPVSRQLLGISILAKKIEDHDLFSTFRKDVKWKPTSSGPSGDPGGSGQN